MGAGLTSPLLLAVGISGVLVAVGLLAVIVRSGSRRMVFGSVAAMFVFLLVVGVYLSPGAHGTKRTHFPSHTFSTAMRLMESKVDAAMARVERAQAATERDRRHPQIRVSFATHEEIVSGGHHGDFGAATFDGSPVVPPKALIPSVVAPLPPVAALHPSSYGIVYDGSGPTPSFEIRLPPDWPRPERGISSLLISLAIGAFLYLGYVLLDASTRGHFTWSLRLLSLLSFSVLVGALVLLRHV